MRLPGFTRFLSRSSCTRPLHSYHFRPLSSLPHIYSPASSSDTRSESYPDFGTYSIILPPEPFQFGTSHIPILPVPPSIPHPPYAIEKDLGNDQGQIDAEAEDPWEGDGRIELNTDEERKVRKAARLARNVREFACGLVKVGVTTNSIDSAIHEFITAHNAYPSPRLYSGFPRSCCTSVNNIIVHGIPDDRPLENGDIVNIDITVFLDGYHGDTSRTFLVGDVDNQGRDLVKTTVEALELGIRACGPGRPFKGIGRAIHDLVHRSEYSISLQFSGHGIGKVFHRPPWILHHANDEPGVMLPGHCFTIEPCLVQGSNPRGWIFPDGWTTSTENCARSSQEEHMVLITETGADVLTR
ncbi:hypothetical protein PILCRDRAFT_683129 [Piloderma croceum F 1598]|uniref:Methionine aminopeptidase n=1 Tax=Piloderma croceum (strain F 1598) TaxID=765440 RepID=A0A0C3F5F3_PILCF|nr:hypothetical protein PILCRDRAFT_683129 [Piloderma croceum F 1598]